MDEFILPNNIHTDCFIKVPNKKDDDSTSFAIGEFDSWNWNIESSISCANQGSVIMVYQLNKMSFYCLVVDRCHFIFNDSVSPVWGMAMFSYCTKLLCILSIAQKPHILSHF